MPCNGKGKRMMSPKVKKDSNFYENIKVQNIAGGKLKAKEPIKDS